MSSDFILIFSPSGHGMPFHFASSICLALLCIVRCCLVLGLHFMCMVLHRAFLYCISTSLLIGMFFLWDSFNCISPDLIPCQPDSPQPIESHPSPFPSPSPFHLNFHFSSVPLHANRHAFSWCFVPYTFYLLCLLYISVQQTDWGIFSDTMANSKVFMNFSHW